MTEKLLVDVNEAAHLLGCGRTFIYGMIQRGELPVVKLGRLTRIPTRALTDFVLSEAALGSPIRGDLDLWTPARRG